MAKEDMKNNVRQLLQKADNTTTKKLYKAYRNNVKLVNDIMFRNEIIERVLRDRGDW